MPTNVADRITSPNQLDCMEIWGGSSAVDNAIAVSGIDAWVISEPYHGDATGGDLHFVSTCGGGKIARFMLADVAGHGRSASDTADRLRQLMRKNINRLDQTRFIRELNREFSSLADGKTFATALLASYFAPTDHLVICNAGHPPPMWYRRSLGTWQQLVHTMPDRVERLANLPLGIVEPTSYYQFAVRLDEDDLVLIYSDALIEARNPNGALLGCDGLAKRLRRMDVTHPERLCHALLEEIACYRNQSPAEDDTTVTLLHHNAGNPPRQSMRQMVKVMGKMIGLVNV